ncbi:MAG: hypothetical protein AB1427_03455 [Thermodesulfobacteriota bacterium]
MSQQTAGKFKKEYVLGPCILIAGILGILFGLISSPDKFPTVSLYLAAIGSIVSIVIPQN